ncbi:MAG: FAD-dependent oxidoreductase, partial [Herminiimonas sp.]|nr:FAD-dependent oxidoreductase [Herminiimonas sp.]
MTGRRLLLVAALIAAVAAYFVFDLGRFTSLDYFKSQQLAIETWRVANPVKAALGFFMLYIGVTGLSLPGAAVLTLIGGAVFGLLWGLLLVSFASSIGATLAMLASRFLLQDWVQKRFGEKLRTINAGVEKEGGLYLFTLRLVPAFPFFAINLLMGLTPIKVRTFYWVSQIGMLAGTAVFVNAGTQLARVDSVAGILSPTLIGSFVLLGIFPLIAKKILDVVSARRVYKGYTRPARYDCNMLVIGAGSAGLVTAYIAAAVKAKVTLVERHKLGGDCLYTGCVPSKALIRSARLLSHIRRSAEFGVRSAEAQFDFAEIMQRVQDVITRIEPHDSVERYTSLGVDVIAGSAKIVSPWEVDVTRDDKSVQRLATRSIVIATGARPFVPPIPGIDDSGYVTSDTVWNLRVLPKRLVVLGGGPIGAELAQSFARMGSTVTQVEMAPRLLMREDEEISTIVVERFRHEGITVLLGHKASRFVNQGGEKILITEHDGSEIHIPFDVVLVAVGRSANLKGYGLEELGIVAERTVETNEYLQTRYPNIYAAGDVAGPFQFTHVAAHQAWYAAVNGLFAPFKKFKADYS